MQSGFFSVITSVRYFFFAVFRPRSRVLISFSSFLSAPLRSP
jgi:hypothetical protein